MPPIAFTRGQPLPGTIKLYSSIGTCGDLPATYSNTAVAAGAAASIVLAQNESNQISQRGCTDTSTCNACAGMYRATEKSILRRGLGPSAAVGTKPCLLLLASPADGGGLRWWSRVGLGLGLGLGLTPNSEPPNGAGIMVCSCHPQDCQHT